MHMCRYVHVYFMEIYFYVQVFEKFVWEFNQYVNV